MSPQEIRTQVAQSYPGSKGWATRVAKMSDQQVFAIFMRLINKK